MKNKNVQPWAERLWDFLPAEAWASTASLAAIVYAYIPPQKIGQTVAAHVKSISRRGAATGIVADRLRIWSKTGLLERRKVAANGRLGLRTHTEWRLTGKPHRYLGKGGTKSILSPAPPAV